MRRGRRGEERERGRSRERGERTEQSDCSGCRWWSPYGAQGRRKVMLAGWLIAAAVGSECVQNGAAAEAAAECEIAVWLGPEGWSSGALAGLGDEEPC